MIFGRRRSSKSRVLGQALCARTRHRARVDLVKLRSETEVEDFLTEEERALLNELERREAPSSRLRPDRDSSARLNSDSKSSDKPGIRLLERSAEGSRLIVRLLKGPQVRRE